MKYLLFLLAFLPQKDLRDNAYLFTAMYVKTGVTGVKVLKQPRQPASVKEVKGAYVIYSSFLAKSYNTGDTQTIPYRATVKYISGDADSFKNWKALSLIVQGRDIVKESIKKPKNDR